MSRWARPRASRPTPCRALPPKARVTAVAGLGRADSRSGPLRQFDVTLELADADARLRPGTTVRVLVQGGDRR